MNIPFIDLKKQYFSIKDEIDTAVSEAINSFSFVGGEFVNKFETEFAKYCNMEYCVGVGNGTDALFLAIKALDIGQGDEIITAANTFIGTSEAITRTGAKVKFADIDPETYNIDVRKIENSITPSTKAIMPVHLYGQPSDMDPIIEIAKYYNLKIISDACQSHGSFYKKIPISELADITCFSFYPGKNLGAYGDAGAIVTNNKEWALKARMLANHGRREKYNHEFEGFNSRMDNLQGAILNVKLQYLDDWNGIRQSKASLYNKLLTDVDEIITPVETKDVKSVYHLYVIRVKNQKRDFIRQYLKSNEIFTGIHYPVALPFTPAYKHLNYNKKDFPEAYRASGEILSLPMYPELGDESISFITEKIKDAIKN